MVHGAATVLAALLTRGNYRAVMAGPFPLLPDTAPAWMRLLLAPMTPVLAALAVNPQPLLESLCKAFVDAAVGPHSVCNTASRCVLYATRILLIL